MRVLYLSINEVEFARDISSRCVVRDQTRMSKPEMGLFGRIETALRRADGVDRMDEQQFF